jgi:hypothetical protein
MEKLHRTPYTRARDSDVESFRRVFFRYRPSVRDCIFSMHGSIVCLVISAHILDSTAIFDEIYVADNNIYLILMRQPRFPLLPGRSRSGSNPINH